MCWKDFAMAQRQVCGFGLKQKHFSLHASAFLRKFIIFRVHMWEEVTSAHNINLSIVYQSKDLSNTPCTHTVHRIPARSRLILVFKSWFHGLALGQKIIQSSTGSPQLQKSSTALNLYEVLKQDAFPSPEVRTTSCHFPFSHDHPAGHIPLPLA